MLIDSVFKGDTRDGIKDISIDCFGRKTKYFLMNFSKIFSILESEVLEAIAQYDFTARSSREVSFMKGDLITLYSQVTITIICQSSSLMIIVILRPVLTGGEVVLVAGKVSFLTSTF